MVLKRESRNPLGACLERANPWAQPPEINSLGMGKDLGVCNFLMPLIHVFEKHCCKGYIGKCLFSGFRKSRKTLDFSNLLLSWYFESYSPWSLVLAD